MDTRPLAYRPADAAATLGISRSKMFELLRAGTIRSIQVGRIRLITNHELTAFLARQAEGAE